VCISWYIKEIVISKLNDRLDQERMIAEKSRASGTEGKVHSIS